MKKSSFIFTLVVFLLISCVACTRTKATVTNDSIPAVKESSEGKMREIVITINNETFHAKIEENVDTKQVFNKLPMNVSMTTMERGRFIYGGNFNPPKGGYKKNFRKGDIALCHSNYILIFYEDMPSGFDSEYRQIGKITSNIENIAVITKGGKLHFVAK